MNAIKATKVNKCINMDEYEFEQLRNRVLDLDKEVARLRKALESIMDSSVRIDGDTEIARFCREVLKK